MSPIRVLRILAAVGVTLALWMNAGSAAALPDPGSYQLRLWMLPPVDSLGKKACLTNHWHSTDPRFDINRALDWTRGNLQDTNCGVTANESVSFRALGSSINEAYDGTWDIYMHGVNSNLPPEDCPYTGGGTVHIGKVKLYGLDGLQKGFMAYAHASLNSSQFNILFQKGATRALAKLNSLAIGNSVADGPGGCWSTWHVHEINSDDAVMYWDAWSSVWDAASLCNCYVTNDDDNWVRRMTASMNIGE